VTERPGPACRHVHYEVEDPIAMITLDQPEALNAFTYPMLDAIRGHVEEAAADPRVVGVIITGTGRGFCVGAHATTMRETTAQAPRNTDPEVEYGDRLPGLFSYLLEQPKPVIAAINGTTAGGGLLLASMCDLRFASADATFVSVFARRGLTAEHGVTWTLPRLVGTGNALDLLLSSRRIDAAEALRIGLVERVTEPNALLDTAKAYIRELAEQVSPASLADIKRMVYTQAGKEAHLALSEAFTGTRLAIGRPDAREGASAYVERRAPRFPRLGGGS
jgi:enoyl-CoA hydratase/carnithine racemase